MRGFKAILVAGLAMAFGILCTQPTANASIAINSGFADAVASCPADPGDYYLDAGWFGAGSLPNPQWGQTFTVPDSPASLQSFSFWVLDFFTHQNAAQHGATKRAELTGHVAKLDGDLLWSSAVETTTMGMGEWGGFGDYEKMTFEIDGGLSLTPGDQYIIYTTLTNDQTMKTQQPANWKNPYSDGTWMHHTDWDTSGGEGWYCPSEGEHIDMAFEATFSGSPTPASIPEPASLAIWSLMALGFVAFGCSGRGRRHANTA